MATSRDQAERLRQDPRNWILGFIYNSADDPRIIVRNRGVIGWTWNFGRPLTWLYVAAVVLAFVAVFFVVGVRLGNVPLAAAVALAGLVALIAVAHYQASGPR